MGTKRYAGKMALMQYEKIVDGSHARYDEGDAFIHGDAQIDTVNGTYTTRIVETDGYHFDVVKDGPMCISDRIDIGMYGGNVTMQIAAPLRYWTLINRD